MPPLQKLTEATPVDRHEVVFPSDRCCRCHVHYVWILSKNQCCYWCDPNGKSLSQGKGKKPCATIKVDSVSRTTLSKGRGRSQKASCAEEIGMKPLTRAIQAVRKETGCNPLQARTALKETWEGEWHHVGLYRARVNYYSVDLAVRYVREMYVVDLHYRY